MYTPQANFPDQHNLLDFVRDAWYFAQTFAAFIDEHPLLIYLGALPFTPTTHLCIKYSMTLRRVRTVTGGFPLSWAGLQLVLSHTGSVTSVAFSPDGTRIISAAADATVHVWDAVSGIEVVPPLRGHDNFVLSAAFSPDGTRIVSGSADKTLRIWDAVSGTGVVGPFEGTMTGFGQSHSLLMVLELFLDHRTKLCAYGMQCPELKLVPHFVGMTRRLCPSHSSPDGARIVLRISRQLCACVGCCFLHRSSHAKSRSRGTRHVLFPVVFSSDGTRIVSGAGEAICIWDAVSALKCALGYEGMTSGLLQLHYLQMPLASSPGQLIALCVYGMLCPALKWCHFSECITVKFFQSRSPPDGARIVSGSADYTVRVWDAVFGPESGPPFPRACLDRFSQWRFHQTALKLFPGQLTLPCVHGMSCPVLK